MEAALARIDRLDPELHAFVRIEGDDALARAREIDKNRGRGEAAGPLAGVPLAHKDMYYRAGKVSSCGSRIRREFRPAATATVLDRLDAAGAIDLGPRHGRVRHGAPRLQRPSAALPQCLGF